MFWESGRSWDSTLAGRLAQFAVEEPVQRQEKTISLFIRLPYGVQVDEDDAQRVFAFLLSQM